MCKHSYIVYILECSDKSYYVGMTSDFETRIKQHQLGTHPHSYTFNKRPVKLIYSVEFNDVYEAIAWERRVKRWSKSKKAALIRDQWDEISKYAKCTNATCVEVGMPRKVTRFKMYTSLSG